MKKTTEKTTLTDKTLNCLLVLAIILAICSFSRSGIIPSVISGDSMEPTQGTGIPFLLNYPGIEMNIKRGDIVAHYNKNGDLCLKRAVDIPGDKVHHEHCYLAVNDTDISGNYDCSYYFYRLGETELGENEFWYVGDNYEHSIDSNRLGKVKGNILGVQLLLITVNNDSKWIFNFNSDGQKYDYRNNQ